MEHRQAWRDSALRAVLVILVSPCPGVAYATEPSDTLLALRSLVHSTSLFTNADFKRADIPPHMTIAEFVTRERSDQLNNDLRGNVPSGTFICDILEYAVPDDKLYFHRVHKLPLG